MATTDLVPFADATRPLDDPERDRLECMQHRPALGCYPESKLRALRADLGAIEARARDLRNELDELDALARGRVT